MSGDLILLSYVSPESFVPLASMISAAAGLMLLFGQRLQAMAMSCWRSLRRARALK